MSASSKKLFSFHPQMSFGYMNLKAISFILIFIWTTKTSWQSASEAIINYVMSNPLFLAVLALSCLSTMLRLYLTMHMAYKASNLCKQIHVCTSFLVPYMMHPCTDSCDISFVLCMWNDLYAYWRQIWGFFLYSACTQMFACKSFWCIDCHAKQHGAVC